MTFRSQSFPTRSRALGVALGTRAQTVALVLALVPLGAVACQGGGEATPDAAVDAAIEAGAPSVCDLLAARDGGSDAGVPDEFGPNAAPAKNASALARLNIYEVTRPRWLTGVEIFLNPTLPNTRVTLAVAEAPSKQAPFTTLFTLQVDTVACPAYVSAGPLQILLRPGHYYAVGFDPNQAVGFASVTDMGSLPIDGAFGRLIGSRTDSSVSLPTLGWDKWSDKDYFRQRLTTTEASLPDGGAPTDAGATDAGATDAN
ncbi:MAG: hypothetical protein KA712_03660 [Myxococcales bacterium]|nr:hypothetical protein [Myxococcales bacterium]